MTPFEKWFFDEVRKVRESLPTDPKTALQDFQATWESVIDEAQNLDLAVGEIVPCVDEYPGAKCFKCASEATREKIRDAEEAIMIGLMRMSVLCAPMTKALPQTGGDRKIISDWVAKELRHIAFEMGIDTPAVRDLIASGVARGILDQIDCAIGDLRGLRVVKSWRDNDCESTSKVKGSSAANLDPLAIQGWLLAKKARGEPCASLAKLAAEYKCTEWPIRNAIDTCDELKQWQKGKVRKSAPVARGIDGAVADSLIQTREVNTSDVDPDSEEDTIMAYLIAEAPKHEKGALRRLEGEEKKKHVRDKVPELFTCILDLATQDERRTLQTIDDDEKRKHVAVYCDQELDPESRPATSRVGGPFHRPVRAHKKA